jgi:alkylation response protein AidB-like acyl-CoA dehydrogenase
MAARMSGAMQAITSMTIDFALMRKQFGQPVARFQAVQQQIAVMAEEAMASAMASSRCFSGPLDGFADIWAAIAKSRSCCAADIVAAIGHAVHGAIGVSEEHALGGHTRRLRRWRDAYGGQTFWEARLGGSILADSASNSFRDFLQAHTQRPG